MVGSINYAKADNKFIKLWSNMATYVLQKQEANFTHSKLKYISEITTIMFN